jgi:hypothetical protein
MKRLPFMYKGSSIICLFFLCVMPAMIHAQSEQSNPGAPPVSQPLINEGSFAVELASAFALSNTDDEVEAESRLGELGIAPRNGWIADYPVTPDIIVELQNSISEASAAGKLSISKDDALKKFNDVTVSLGFSISPYTPGTNYQPTQTSCANYPNPEMINNSYTTEGPPVVTYYCPPPDYYELYTWVPCPFWWSDLWFPGFFILHDFHRIVHRHKKVVVITNHFNEIRSHHVFRIDPMERFRGRTFGGIGMPRHRDSIPTGIPSSERKIFNAPHAQGVPGGKMGSPTHHGREMISPPSGGGDRGGRGGGRRD